MDIFNRIVVVLGLLLVAAVLILGMLQPLYVVDVLQATTDGLKDVMYSNYFLYLGVIVVSLLIIVVFLWLELRRRTRKTVKVHQVSSGDVQLSVASVGQSLEYYVTSLEGVIRVKPKIKSKGKAVDVTLNVETRPDVDVPSKTDEICRVARDVVEGKLGLTLRKVHAKIKHAPYARGTKPQEAAPVAPLPSFGKHEPEPYVPPVEIPPAQPPVAAAPEEPAEEEPDSADEFVLPPLEGDEGEHTS